MSVHAALEAAFGTSAIGPRRLDTSVFGDFSDFDELRPDVRALVAANAQELHELRDYRVVSGHFSLPSLLTLAPPAAIATVVREPRARLLSLYCYWRVTSQEHWHPYDAHTYARRPLNAFLAEPALAAAVDNQMCRLVLAGDPRIPRRGFIAAGDVEPLAHAVVDRLDGLGFVGLHELPDALWAELSRFFGVRLARATVNVTGQAPGAAPQPSDEGLVTDDAFELLERRCAVDRIVYRHLAAHACGDRKPVDRLADVAFARQLARLGDAIGDSAEQLAEATRSISALTAELSAVRNARDQVVRERDAAIDRADGALRELAALQAVRRRSVSAAIARPFRQGRARRQGR